MKGCVYILQNEAYPEDVLKIGMTQRTAAERAAEIFIGSTGIPTPFVVAYERPTHNCSAAEELVHQKLSNFRINRGREFFKIALNDAIVFIDEIIEQLDKIYEAHKKPVGLLASSSTSGAQNESKVRNFKTLGEPFAFKCIECKVLVRANILRPYVELKCPNCSFTNKLQYKKSDNVQAGKGVIPNQTQSEGSDLNKLSKSGSVERYAEKYGYLEKDWL